MKKELKERVVKLLADIHEAGFGSLVAENHAFQTLRRIIKTGTSLPDKIKEPTEETEYCAEVFMNPINWGISDPAWKAFCEKWRQA
jgi:hypothetical protein